MPSTAASFTPPALLLGLGARVISDRFSGTEASLSSTILVGLWQGVGLLYAVQSSDFYFLVIAGIAVRLLFDFSSDQDFTKILITVITTGLGFFVTDFLTQVLDSPSTSSAHVEKRSTRPRDAEAPHSSHRRRRVRRRREGTDRTNDPRHEAFRQAMSDITSVDTHSELVGPRPNMTPLERDVATLRARAALADSERRRYKEEKKWALASGNTARAEQMAWQVKRYKALMKSFQREADAKLSEGSNGVISDQAVTSPDTRNRATSSRRPAHNTAGGNGIVDSPERRTKSSRKRREHGRSHDR